MAGQINHRRPLRPGETYLFQTGQVWEASVFGSPVFLVKLVEFDYEVCSGIETWQAERLRLDGKFPWTTAINTSHFKRGPLSEMAIIAWWATERGR